MSLLITVETGGVLDVALGEVPVVDGGMRNSGGDFGGRGDSGSRGWEGANGVRYICPSSISDEERLVSDYTLHEESIVGQVNGWVTSYLIVECLVYVLVNVFHNGYVAEVAFG